MPSEATTPPSTPKASGSLADYLWFHFSTIYPHRWTSAMGVDPRGHQGKVWATALATLTRDQIDAGLEACRNSADEWPPSLPAFKAACYEIPPLAAVKLEMRSQGLRSLFTHMVWRFIDSTAYAAAHGDKADRMLRDAYELAREHVMRGGDVPAAPAGAIEQEEKPRWVAPPVERRSEILERARRAAGLAGHEPEPEEEVRLCP